MVPADLPGRTTGDRESPVAGEKSLGSGCEHPEHSAFSPADVPLARRFCLSFLLLDWLQDLARLSNPM